MNEHKNWILKEAIKSPFFQRLSYEQSSQENTHLVLIRSDPTTHQIADALGCENGDVGKPAQKSQRTEKFKGTRLTLDLSALSFAEVDTFVKKEKRET